jgi:hypothetical protein
MPERNELNFFAALTLVVAVVCGMSAVQVGLYFRGEFLVHADVLSQVVVL